MLGVGDQERSAHCLVDLQSALEMGHGGARSRHRRSEDAEERELEPSVTSGWA
jgi:hypothetical protein